MDANHIEEELKNARRESSLGARLKTALSVPSDIRKLVGKASKRRHGYWARNEIEENEQHVRTHFEGISARSRSKIIKSLLPKLATVAEAAWQTLERRTYQRDGTRKPFRCPQATNHLDVDRGKWLLEMAVKLGDLDRDVAWLAAWAPHVADYGDATEIGWLLAGALDMGGPVSDEVFEILTASASGEHEVGQMGRHVTQALMSCGREDAWEFNEKLLLAAQRQEGVRQAMLEAVDESHPEAFKRMLRLILEHRLSRFSSVVRAVDTWFGFMWDGSSGMKVDQVLTKVLAFFDDEQQRQAALRGGDAEHAYLALWTKAFEDVELAVPEAVSMLKDEAVEKRFVATHLLVQCEWPSVAQPLAQMLMDDDLRVAARALAYFAGETPKVPLFEQLEHLMARVKKRTNKLDSIVWPWWQLKLERSAVAAAMLKHSEGTAASRLLPYVRDLDSWSRASYITDAVGMSPLWSKEKKQPKVVRGELHALIVEMLGDASADVRRAAFAALASTKVEQVERARLVSLLKRKAGDLRSGALERLAGQADAELASTAQVLIEDKDAMRRLAGLELMRHAVEQDRMVEQARLLTKSFQAANKLNDVEMTHVEAVLGERSDVATREDALGLLDPSKRVDWPRPCSRPLSGTPAVARKCLESLAELLLQHGQTEVEDEYGDRTLLIEGGRRISGPGNRKRAEENEGKLPLLDVFRTWESTRDAALRDDDGLELVRAWIAERDDAPWGGPMVKKVTKGDRWSPGFYLMQNLVEWAVFWQRPEGAFAFLVDGFERELAKLSESHLRTLKVGPEHYHYLDDAKPHHVIASRAKTFLVKFRKLRGFFPKDVDHDSAWRAYGLARWFERATTSGTQIDAELVDFRDAVRTGRFEDGGESELLDLLVGPSTDGDVLREASRQKPVEELADSPELLATVAKVRERIVALEAQRGDRESAASSLVLKLRWTGGLETLGPAMQSLGSTKFARSHSWWGGKHSRKDTLSHLVICSTPRAEDTHEKFVAWAKEAGLRESRLVELAAYAPHWAGHVNAVLEWPGLESAVWWVHAHTKDERWDVAELEEQWTAQISERTPLTGSELTEGAVDVAWFAEVYALLGKERWGELYKAAKYASSSGGHKRAQLFASAMNGETSRDELLARIDEKRHQDTVRALGLVPLASGDKGQADLLSRYHRMQEFQRESRKFGSQRQQSEGRAMAIGLENLARTAGYKDPLRLQWAMEMESIADLRDGPVVLQKEQVSLALGIDEDGVPSIAVCKGERALKSIPAKLRKDADVVQLKDRLKELKRQASRVQRALEDSMCRGDAFDAAELQQLLQHPILAPSLQRLVFLGDDIAGYPVNGGKALIDHAGTKEPVRKAEVLRIAHPHDLLDRGDWSDWQRECYRSERVQPFKQVFREVYPITDSERSDKLKSKRYAGHQVQPRQALALFGGRSWVTRPEEGISKTYHAEGLTARLTFQEAFYTPADVEGLTFESVVFTKKGEDKPVDLGEVPVSVFSETMRDLDLVVSVAHQGGVDPEASASTIEMRMSLMREVTQLLGLTNVEFLNHNVIIRGELADYSLHLGSAVASVHAGPSLVIVAVHSQHRGRLFLPFADDDPRTAEVIAKMLLLARDKEIKDPNILDQIRRAVR